MTIMVTPRIGLLPFSETIPYKEKYRETKGQKTTFSNRDIFTV